MASSFKDIRSEGNFPFLSFTNLQDWNPTQQTILQLLCATFQQPGI